jgi:hypothetical protein
MQKFTLSLGLMMATLTALPALAADGSVIALDAPGALQSLARSNPDHHQRASKLLLAAATQPCHDSKQERMIAVQFDAQDLQCGMVYKTSFPAKRDITFTLDKQRYASQVVVDDGQARLMPLK